MIEQVLFTALGERLNRPAFGCGLRGHGMGQVLQSSISETVEVVGHDFCFSWPNLVEKVNANRIQRIANSE
jgi:hypothetical protein